MKQKSKKTGIAATLTKAELFFDKNKKMVIIVFAAIAVIVGGYFGYREFYLAPQNNRAADEIFAAQNFYRADSLNLALNGNGKYMGFVAIADEYSSTKTGNLACYYAGMCYLKQGKFQNAIDYLERYKAHDLFTPSLKEANIGNAYLELGKTKEAITHYEKACSLHENEITTPYALMRLGIAYEMGNEFSKAVECYKKIKSNYPQAPEFQEIDKYIAHAEALIKG